jgi:Predicted transcriptional regulators
MDVPMISPEFCGARGILDRVGDKWSLYVVSRLGEGTKRFTELKRGVDGISQRMLTVTLRGLERDGIISRTMYPVMPPHVEYALTDMGRTLLDSVRALIVWAETHLDETAAARAAYDARMEREAHLTRPDGA